MIRHITAIVGVAAALLLLAACSRTDPAGGDGQPTAAPRIEVEVLMNDRPIRLDSASTVGRHPTFVIGVSHRDAVASVDYRFQDGEWQRIGVGSFVTFSPVEPLPDGDNRIDVRARSTGGQQSTVSIPFTVDGVAPLVTSFRVNGVEQLNNPNVEIDVPQSPSVSVLVQARASDAATGTLGIEMVVLFDGEEVRWSEGGLLTWQVESGELAIGLHAIELFATDRAGNTSGVQSVLVNVLPPPEEDGEGTGGGDIIPPLPDA